MLAKPRKELNKQSPQKNGRLAGANPATSLFYITTNNPMMS